MTAKTKAIDNVCIDLGVNGTVFSSCGKISAEGFCPHHQILLDDLLKEPQRRKERAERRREERNVEEQFLATSPLHAAKPQFVERSGRNGRARPSNRIDECPISQPSDKIHAESDPVAEVLVILASADFVICLAKKRKT
jgi:hypothetical protein